MDLKNVTRPKLSTTDRLYLHFATEKSANFLYRKTTNINNITKSNIRLTPFIPPQLYNRFADLSKTHITPDRKIQTLKHRSGSVKRI